MSAEVETLFVDAETGEPAQLGEYYIENTVVKINATEGYGIHRKIRHATITHTVSRVE